MTFEVAALGFGVPWALGAFVVLPVIWWLLKVNPPAPRLVQFPAVRFLFGLRREEQTPSKTPLLLLLLRFVIAGLIILAVARPLLNPLPQLSGSGPLLAVIDDGWASAEGWQERIETLKGLVGQADREGRSVVLAHAAPRPSVGSEVSLQVSNLLTAKEAVQFIEVLKPQPWPVDRPALLASLSREEIRKTIGKKASVAWLSDGLNGGQEAETAAFVEALQRFGSVRVYTEQKQRSAMLLLAPRSLSTGLAARVIRAEAGRKSTVWVRATTENGRLIDRVALEFGEGEKLVEAVFDIPNDLRRELFRLDIEGVSGAGAVILLDERWRRRPVGLISGGGFESDQPLLSDLYYLERALEPYNEVRRGDIGPLIQDGLSVLMLSDVGNLSGQDQKSLAAWIEQGGVLVRFAGPRLAASMDDFVPVPLRNTGGRALGGALSWQEPALLGPFGKNSPFSKLYIPDDVFVSRQVLAEPSPEVTARTWARLVDGTPLVTGLSRGEGWLILFHTTANTDWSNLALSGLFVDMLRRVVELGDGVGGKSEVVSMPPLKVLDGFGRLGPPTVDSLPIQAGDAGIQAPEPGHPPGLYGTPMVQQALNLGDEIEELVQITNLPAGIKSASLGVGHQLDLGPAFMLVAIILTLVDYLIVMWMRGLLSLERWKNLGSLVVFLVCSPALVLIYGTPAYGQQTPTGVDPEALETLGDEFLAEVIGAVRLAYVITGDDEVDSVSRAGLMGLSWVLRQRTAVEPALPVAVDPEQGSLILYPLIYWPMTDQQSSLSRNALDNIAHYLRVGGMILLDTRDKGLDTGIETLGMRSTGLLQQMLGNLNLPPLSLVPQGHALTQSFYLTDHFPGRWDGGDVWVEQYQGGVNDGVSSLVVGGNDWASAWALSPSGSPLFAVVPGGERQREMAFRFGINLTMYALTGSYKADQVHIPAILRRIKRGGTTDVN